MMTELPNLKQATNFAEDKKALSVPTRTQIIWKSVCFRAVDKRIYFAPAHATCLHRNCKFIITVLVTVNC